MIDIPFCDASPLAGMVAGPEAEAYVPVSVASLELPGAAFGARVAVELDSE